MGERREDTEWSNPLGPLIRTMRTFYSSNFTGRYPVGTAAIVVAETKAEAAALLEAELSKRGLRFDGTLQEVVPAMPQVLILLDGDY